MMRSLMSGVSGMVNHQLKIDVVGNNLANINTVGFKSDRISFADQISQLLSPGSGTRNNYGGVNPVQVGLGMKVQSIDTNFAQGSLESTGYANDLALQGNGFFIVRNGEDTYFTRAGNFNIDADGNLTANDGLSIIQGWLADETGELSPSNSVTDLVLPIDMKMSPRATDNVVLYSNLDSTATNADATMTAVGSSGATSVSGTATDGIGGTHSIAITGAQATQSTGTSATGGMTVSDSLAALGVTDVSDFTVTVDNGTSDAASYTITGLSTTSTVGDLVNALNDQVHGATFELSGGNIVVTRDYAGDGASYNVHMEDAGTGDITASIFGAATFDANSGTASTLSAVDTFTDNATGTVRTEQLSFAADDRTGLMTELSGLGGGGVTILSGNGFTATAGDPLLVTTEDTSHTTSISVYDSMGKTHNLSMTFTKTGTENQWAWEAEVGEPAVAISGNTGLVSFNEDGSLSTFSYDNSATEFSFNPGNNAADVNIAFSPGSTGMFDGITQTDSAFSTHAVDQNGYGMGELEDIMIDENGVIVGSFTNGQNQDLAQIAVADFANEQGLKRVGGNLYEQSVSSGDPTIGQAQTNFNSSIQSGYLEMSNVDIVEEFTELITAQRGFQANARIVTVSDQVLAEATALKR